jgi:hypothetical protein
MCEVMYRKNNIKEWSGLPPVHPAIAQYPGWVCDHVPESGPVQGTDTVDEPDQRPAQDLEGRRSTTDPQEPYHF